MTRLLVALSGPMSGRSFALERDVTRIGREPESDILIDTQWASRRHCAIERRSEGFVLVDRESHNGTSVNGIPVTQKLLAGGDRLTLGGVTFLFVDGDADANAGSGSDTEGTTLELDDTPLSLKDTVQLDARDSRDGGQSRPVTKGEAAANALAATLGIIRTLGRPGDDGLAEEILDRILEVLPAERGAILLGSRLDALTAVAYHPARFPVSRSALATALGNKTALLTNQASRDLGGDSIAGAGVTSLACLPLIVGDAILGALYLDRRDANAVFPESQLELLVALALIAARVLANSQEVKNLKYENRRLTEEFALEHDMVGESAPLAAVQKILARAAPTDATVLIEGESGTGKELAARAVHRNSGRRDAPFVKVDCTGLSENLLTSELFGHERGAFTGAIQQKKGKLEVAHGGTVFLDEIGELPLPLQAQLLRVLQDREFERVGGTRPIGVDIRLVAATNRDLRDEVDKGNFREDLFFRLNVVRLTLPPLRERRGDVVLLARYYAGEFAGRVKRTVSGISPEAVAILEGYDWPGNIRELANTIERAVVLGMTEVIVPDDLPEILVQSKVARRGGTATTYHDAVAQRKRELILDAVARAGGNITEAAKLLELHPNYLHRLIRNLDLRDEIKS